MPPKAITYRSSLLSVRPLPEIAEDDPSPWSSSPDLTPPPSIPPRSLRRHSLPANSFTSSPLSSSPPLSPSAFPLPPPYTFPNRPYLTPDSKETVLFPQQHRFRQRRGNPPPPWTNPSLLARRGGWYRLTLLILLLVALIIGLAAGLTIGLRNRNASTSPTASNSGDDDTTVPFPLGSWTLPTYLSRTSTACVPSTPKAWTCYPDDRTFAVAMNSSAVSWAWIITDGTSSSDKLYRVSSSTNPFAPVFANATAQLLDSNTAAERLVFNTTLDSYTVNLPLAGRVATCVYARSVVLSGTLWTKERADGTVGSEEGLVGDERVFQRWPGRVEVTEMVTGVPACVDGEGKRVLVAELAAGAGQCGCWYGNKGLG